MEPRGDGHQQVEKIQIQRRRPKTICDGGAMKIVGEGDWGGGCAQCLAFQVMHSGAVINVIATRRLENTLFTVCWCIAVFAFRYIDHN